MENPYKPPGAYVTDKQKDPAFSLYNIANNLYVIFVVASLLILLYGRNLTIDVVTLYLLLVFFTPVVTYMFVRLRHPRLIRYFLLLHLAVVGTLIAIYLINLKDRGLDQGIGYFMILINIVSFISARYQWRALQRLTNQTDKST